MGKNKFRLSQRKQSKSTLVGDQSQGPKHVSTQTDDIGVDEGTQTENTEPQTDTTTDPIETDPCHMDTEHQIHIMSPVPGSRIVQLPIEIFLTQSITSLNQLYCRLANMKCINNWFLMATSSQPVSKIHLVRVDGSNVFTLEVGENLQWVLHIGNNCVPSSSSIFQSIPSVVEPLHSLREIVDYIDRCSVCKGNADPKFAPIVAKCKGVFKDKTGKKLTYLIAFMYDVACTYA